MAPVCVYPRHTMRLPGYSTSILQVFIIADFDIKALVQLHEATFQHHTEKKLKKKKTPETNDRLQQNRCVDYNAQMFFTFWMTLGPCWKVTSCSCATSAFNVKGDYDEGCGRDLNSQAATWYDEGIHKLMPRYDKYLNVEGNYVEKHTKVSATTCIFSFCIIIIKEYLAMTKHSLLYGQPSYFAFWFCLFFNK